MLIVNPALEVLRRGMKAIGMTQAELFEDYRSLGGRVKQPNTIGAWLRGQTDVPYTQMTLLYRAVNLRLLQKGKPPIEIPFRSGLMDDQPAATGTEGVVDSPPDRSTKGRHLTAPAYITLPASARRVA